MATSDDMRPAEPITVPGRLEVVPERQHSDAVRTRDLERSVCARSVITGRDAKRGIIHTPQTGAMVDLVQTLASTGELHQALRVYGMVCPAFLVHVMQSQGELVVLRVAS